MGALQIGQKLLVSFFPFGNPVSLSTPVQYPLNGLAERMARESSSDATVAITKSFITAARGVAFVNENPMHSLQPMYRATDGWGDIRRRLSRNSPSCSGDGVASTFAYIMSTMDRTPSSSHASNHSSTG